MTSAWREIGREDLLVLGMLAADLRARTATEVRDALPHISSVDTILFRLWVLEMVLEYRLIKKDMTNVKVYSITDFGVRAHKNLQQNGAAP